MAELLKSRLQLSSLMDACSRCSTVFRIAMERVHDDPFEDLSAQLRKTLDRFVFELQKENDRIGAGEPQHSANCGLRIYSTNPALLRVQASLELHHALEGYDSMLKRGLHGHARAMMQRQRETLILLLRDLDQMIRGYTSSVS